MTELIHVAVVGSGHAALTVISALNRYRIAPTVFSNEQRIGDTWRNRYDALRLNTDAKSSTIPHRPPEQPLPKWPTGHQWADYLDVVANQLEYQLQPVEVLRITRGPDRFTIETAAGAHHATNVVVATGRNRIPHVPEWPGLHDTHINVIHSSRFRSASDFPEQDVLVIGGGNSGTEIAHLLAATADRVTLSVRTRPLFVRRETLGISITQVGRLAKHVPAPILDRSARALQRFQTGDLSALGLGPPERDLSHDLIHERGPTVDSGFVDSVKAGEITVVGAIERFETDEVVLIDGTRLKPHTVIAATGFRTGLEELVPPDLVDASGQPHATQPPYEAETGFFFAGFGPASLTSFMPDFVEYLPTIAATIHSRL